MAAVRKVVFPLDQGWAGLVATSRGLVALIPRRNSREEAEAELVQALPRGIEAVNQLTGGVFQEEDILHFASDMNAYYQGDHVGLDYPVDWETTGVTDFQKRALQACKQIPYGQWATYGDLAKAVGNHRASRAIGGAMHINPVSLVVP